MNPIPIIIQLVKKEIKILLRARFTSFLILFGPFLLVLVIGQAYSTTDWHGIKVGVYLEVQDEFTSNLESKITDNRFTIQQFNSLEDCINGVKFTDLHACIAIPDQGADATQGRVDIYLDYSRLSLAFALADMMQGKISREGKRISLELTKTLLEKLNSVIGEVSGNTLALDKLLNMSVTEMDDSFDQAISQIANLSININLSSYNLSSTASNGSYEALQEAQAWIGDFKGEVGNMEGNLSALHAGLVESTVAVSQLGGVCGEIFYEVSGLFVGTSLYCNDSRAIATCSALQVAPPDIADVVTMPSPTETPYEYTCDQLDCAAHNMFCSEANRCEPCPTEPNYACGVDGITYLNPCTADFYNTTSCERYCPCPLPGTDIDEQTTEYFEALCMFCECENVAKEAELGFGEVIDIVEENKNLSRIENQLAEAENILSSLDPLSLLGISGGQASQMLTQLESRRLQTIQDIIFLRTLVNSNMDNATTFLDALSSVTSDLTIYTELRAEDIITPIQTVVHDIHSDKKTLELLYPAVVVLILMMVGILSSTTLVLSERASRATIRNFIAPIRTYLHVSGIYLTNVLIMILQLIFILAVGALFFGVPTFTNFANVLAFVILLTTIFILMGMCVGYIFKSPTVSNLIAILLVLLFLFMSGVLGVPIQAMPENLAAIIRFNPYLIGESALRKLLTVQLGWDSIIEELKICLAYIVVLAAALVGLQIINKKKESKG